MTTQNSPQTSLSPEVTTGGVVTKPVVIPVDKAISWAKLYLSLGWSLVPISPDTKIPTVAWKKYQETPPTLEEVTSWLNHGWYLAVVTGDVSGICVVDDDRIKHNLPEYGFTSPLIATTQSGGKHYYYLYDREIHTHVNSKIHVDLKAWHSYVLLPPFKGRKWETDLVSNIKNLYPLPEETITLIRSDMENQVNHTPLEKQALLDIKEGSRSDSLYKMACSIFNEFDFDTGKRLLISVNDTYSPPLLDKQRDYDIQRAYDYVQSHPKDTLTPVSTQLKSKIKLSDTTENTPKNSPPVLSPEEAVDLSKKYPILDNTTFFTKEYPPQKWLIDKLLRIGGISFLVGESGTGKTLVSLSIAKAISEGSLWLDHFPTTQMKVLIIDKENTPVDIQKHYQSMNIQSPNIYNFFTEENYDLLNKQAKLTPIAIYLQSFIKENDIGLVILDSAIDFLIGEENDSQTVAANINGWKEMCGQATILSIHHFKKADMRIKVKAADMLRGSSVWLSSAQSVLAFSVASLNNPEFLIVEHAKTRSGRKQKPFEIEMTIRADYRNLTETVVTGFKYVKEVSELKLKIDTAKEATLKLLTDNPDTEYTATEIKGLLATQGVIDKNIDLALPQLVQEGEIYNSSGTGVRGSPKAYKVCVTNMLENIIKEEENK